MACPSNQLKELRHRAARLAAEAHRRWHDPESSGGPRPGPTKRVFVEAIAAAPRLSQHRRLLFRAMHNELKTLRGAYVGSVERSLRRAREARQDLVEAKAAARQD
ncbi:MAG: hypothetical protein VX155_08660 [Planctomycetota bacterium]|nr:hypothetical protein [Planctomycetota bacterium]MEC8093882.1 hypothetical protein [Planctomycetota bacterium]MEC8413722.1 hypothetical protein [Planctomycetota bacterium]MEC8769904.1 hypothetical protein [Planctomycetota bacterium]